jgi:hypothetical protein
MRSLPFVASIWVLVLSTAVFGQAFAPQVRIVERIDESNLMALKGNTHPYANARDDRGRVSPDLPMTDLILVLSRDTAQQAAFDKFVAEQYDPSSANFHHWLTPEEVGTNFGPAETDIATISNWLTGHGFTVDEVSKSRMSIRFSGTAGLVEAAFHTEMHNLEVKGAAHIGNMSDPQIPAALSTTVVGVKALHNFFPRPMHRMGSTVTRDSKTGKWLRASTSSSETRTAGARPEFGTVGSSSGILEEDITPYDFATIYNVLPLWTASTAIDGTGQTIAIAGTSAINAGTSITGSNGTVNDVATFRAAFGLPTYTSGQFTNISGNSQPLQVCSTTDTTQACNINDLEENSLDVEWSGAVAKGAKVILVSSYPASASDDNLYDSESYIVQNATAKIMNVSYGNCEQFNGTGGNVEYYNLWQQAASEGIAVFVSSGDGAAATCDAGGDANGNPYSAQYGLAVSGLASTPYNTAVGGTDFNWCSLTVAASATECPAAPYWSSTNNATTGASAAGYIPEVPWNDTCASSLALGFLESEATSVSVSGVTDAETACEFVYSNSLTASPIPNLAYFVDTIGGGGGASGCVANTSTTTTIGACSTGATSTGVSTNPDTGTSQASLTLVANGWPKPSWQKGVAGIPSDGVRDLPDVSFFASDGFLTNSAYLICVSNNDTQNKFGGFPACSYSTTSEPITQEVGGTSVSSPAMAGVMALINQKAGSAQGNPNAELYKLAAKQTYSACTAESVTTNSSCYFNDIDTGTNAVPCDYGALEGGVTGSEIDSPNCTPSHSGDLLGILSGYGAATGYDLATGLGSLNVYHVVEGWSSATGTSSATVTVTPAATSLAQTSSLSVTVTVAGSTTPTGNVTLTGGGYTSSSQALSSGTSTFTIPASSLSVGADTLTAYYGGDSNYTSETGTASVTVTGTTSSDTFTLSATTPTAVAPGTATTSTITVATTDGYVGTASLTCALTTSPSSAVDLPTCKLSPTSVALSASTTSGTVTATISSTAATSSELVRPRPLGKGRNWTGAGGGAVLAVVLLIGIPKRRRSWRAMLGALVLLAALAGLSGCGDFWQAPSTTSAAGTTAGSYTFTVTGTGSPTVSSTVTTTFVVTIN